MYRAASSRNAVASPFRPAFTSYVELIPADIDRSSAHGSGTDVPAFREL